MKWTDVRKEQVRKMWNDGLTSQEIADIFAKEPLTSDVTRNSIIGLINRLGMLGVRHTEARKMKLARGLLPNATKKLVRPPVYKEGERKILSIPNLDITLSDMACEISQLTNYRCHWIMGEKVYCGRPNKEGLPYCAGHAKMAYQPSAKRTKPSFFRIGPSVR